MKIPRLLIVSLIFPIRNRPLAQLCEAENKYVFTCDTTKLKFLKACKPV